MKRLLERLVGSTPTSSVEFSFEKDERNVWKVRIQIKKGNCDE